MQKILTEWRKYINEEKAKPMAKPNAQKVLASKKSAITKYLLNNIVKPRLSAVSSTLKSVKNPHDIKQLEKSIKGVITSINLDIHRKKVNIPGIGPVTIGAALGLSSVVRPINSFALKPRIDVEGGLFKGLSLSAEIGAAKNMIPLNSYTVAFEKPLHIGHKHIVLALHATMIKGHIDAGGHAHVNLGKLGELAVGGGVHGGHASAEAEWKKKGKYGKYGKYGKFGIKGKYDPEGAKSVMATWGGRF